MAAVASFSDVSILAATPIGAIATFVALGGVVAAIRLSLSATVEWLQRLAGLCLISLGILTVLGKRGKSVPEFRLVRALPAQPHARALLLGVGCGAAWSPCVGPLLGAALTAASASGSTWRGSCLLFTFGCGVVTPFCALARLRLGRFGPRVGTLGRRLSGTSIVVMLVLGVLLLAGWYDAVVQRLDIGT